MLSTLPFVALLAGLALLALAIALVAMPRSGHPPTEREPPQRELGTAPPGWLERSKE